MKKNLMALALSGGLLLAFSIKADDSAPSLCCESRNAVALAAAQGALAGFGAFVGFHMLTTFTVPNVSHHRYAASIMTLTGAALAAIWKYQHTPERHFDFAHKELVRVAHHELFQVLVTTDPAQLIITLKDRYFREKLPLYTAYLQVDKICAVVDEAKESLKKVLESGRSDLHSESNELLMIADMYLVILKDVFKQIKEDANFISECNAGTLELIMEAQEAAASAAQSSAFSQQMALMSNQNAPKNSISTQIIIN